MNARKGNGNIRWALAFIIPALFTVYICLQKEQHLVQSVSAASLHARIVRLQVNLDAAEQRHDELRQALYEVEMK